MNISKLSVSLLGLCVFFSVSSPTQASDPKFGYACETCPTNWGNLNKSFELCDKGTSQSPIVVSRTQVHRKTLPGLQVFLENADYEVERLTTNFEAFLTDSDLGITLGWKDYDLVQFHFHSRSEHFLYGEQFPLEAHLVHRTPKGDLAVLGVFIKKGEKLSGLNPLLAVLDEVVKADVGDFVDLKAFDASILLPESRKTYRYSGSTTTPACVEPVTWILLANPIEMSGEQIEMIQNVIRGFNDGFDNNRPIQPLNGRKVYSDAFDDDDDDDDDNGDD